MTELEEESMSERRSGKLAYAHTICDSALALHQLPTCIVEPVTLIHFRRDDRAAAIPTELDLLPPPLPPDVFEDESHAPSEDWAFDDVTRDDPAPLAAFEDETRELPPTLLEQLLPEALFGWIEETLQIAPTVAASLPTVEPLPFDQELEGTTLVYDRVWTPEPEAQAVAPDVEQSSERLPAAHLPFHVQLAMR